MSKPGWVIRSVILYSDLLFAGGSFAVHPETSTNTVVVPLKRDKNVEETIMIQVLMGAGMNAPFFLIHSEPHFKIPKFAFFAPLDT